jgi:hypothetical protein
MMIEPYTITKGGEDHTMIHLASIRANDDHDDIEIRISAEPDQEGLYRLTASNGDDVDNGAHSLEHLRRDVASMWGGWESYEPCN